MKISILQLVLLAELSRTTSGFLQNFFNPMMTPKPELSQLIDNQPEQKLTINLDIGKQGDPSRLAIRDMIFGLHNDVPDQEHVPLPGKNGPHPNLSSGIRKVRHLRLLCFHFVSANIFIMCLCVFFSRLK